MKLWVLRREHALKASGNGIEVGFEEWMPHTMDLADSVMVRDVDLVWAQSDDGAYGAKTDNE